MKRALKWLGWGLLALIGLGVFLSLEKSTQATIVVVGVVWWTAAGFWKAAEERRAILMRRLDQIEAKVDTLINHPLNTRYIVEGMEGLVDEYRDRRRHSGDLSASGSDDWPFPKGG